MNNSVAIVDKINLLIQTCKNYKETIAHNDEVDNLIKWIGDLVYGVKTEEDKVISSRFFFFQVKYNRLQTIEIHRQLLEMLTLRREGTRDTTCEEYSDYNVWINDTSYEEHAHMDKTVIPTYSSIYHVYITPRIEDIKVLDILSGWVGAKEVESLISKGEQFNSEVAKTIKGIIGKLTAQNDH